MNNFFRACSAGVISEHMLFLTSDAVDIDKPNDDGDTGLMLASKNGHRKVVEFLLKKGANPNLQNNSGITALMNANHHKEIASLLIDSGADVNMVNDRGMTALIYAASSIIGDTTIALLISKGADINIQNNIGNTALMQAAEFDNYENVRLLIAEGADKNIQNDNGETALIKSSHPTFSKSINLLLEADLDIQENNGNTALIWCVINKRHEMVEALIDKGANKDIINSSGACAFDLADIISIVLLKPELLNYQDKNGDTFLMKACIACDENTLFFLINKGADLYLENKQGVTVSSILEGASKY